MVSSSIATLRSQTGSGLSLLPESLDGTIHMLTLLVTFPVIATTYLNNSREEEIV